MSLKFSLSPPRPPRYNASVEIGCGSIKTGTFYEAVQHGWGGTWTSDDVDAARERANHTLRPWGVGGPTPAQRWQQRPPITQAQRDQPLSRDFPKTSMVSPDFPGFPGDQEGPQVIVGDPSIFAIESVITKAYSAPGLRALGCFLLHVKDRCYGVRAADATMLALSFDRTAERLAYRGEHTAPFAAGANAGEIADAFRKAIFTDEQDHSYLGTSRTDIRQLFYVERTDRMWAPDGDQAFDDGSYVLQFDVGDRVRLIAFRCCRNGLHDPATLSEVWLTQDDFYSILQQWHDAFLAEWESLPKEDGK